MNSRWPDLNIVLWRGLITTAVLMVVFWLVISFMLLTDHPVGHAAGITGKYVQLLAVANDGRVSVVHDLTAAECDQIVDKLRPLAEWRELSCLPIDYNRENKKR